MATIQAEIIELDSGNYMIMGRGTIEPADFFPAAKRLADSEGFDLGELTLKDIRHERYRAMPPGYRTDYDVFYRRLSPGENVRGSFPVTVIDF